MARNHPNAGGVVSKIQIGQVFHRLTVLRFLPGGKNLKVECQCSCGKVVMPQRGALLNGRAKSCGCLRREILGSIGIKHGMSASVEYAVFRSMRDRCENPANKHYHNYGGRGLRVLFPDFHSFYQELGPRQTGGWIDRIDNNRGYEPGNCRWVSPSENQKNKRVSKVWEIDGVTYESSVEAAAALSVTPSVVVRGCNGCTRGGRYYPPKPGWSCRLKYDAAAWALAELNAIGRAA
jgi:hypothetical protein